MFSCNLAKVHQNKLSKKYTKKGFQEKLFVHDGSKMNYQEGGEGETVVLIHGFGGDGKITWESAARYLVDDYHVVVPDLLWFGKSESTSEPSLQLQVDVLSKLIESLKVKQVTLVGISYGGFVSLGISLKKKEVIKQTIIVDSPGMTYDISLLDSLCSQNDVASVQDIFVPNNGDEVQRLFDIAFYKDKKIPGFIRPAVYELYFSQHHEQLSKLLASLPAEKEKFQQHKRTDFPEKVSLIWGEFDEVFPMAEGHKLAKYFGTDVQVVPDAGHAPNIEQTKIFNQQLINLLKAAK